MTFSRSRKYDFPPEFTIGGSEILIEYQSIKILGIQIQSNLKWDAQCRKMIGRASSKLWILRRMKALGLPPGTLAKYWATEGRIHLEMSCGLWSGAITRAQDRALERVQRLALSTITSWTLTYQEQLELLSLERLDERRQSLCLTFARRTASKSRNRDIFVEAPHLHNTRAGAGQYLEPRARTTAYYNSAVPYLSRLLNASAIV